MDIFPVVSSQLVVLLKGQHEEVAALLSGLGKTSWRSLCREANINAVAPLLYNSLIPHRRQVPDEYWLELERSYWNTALVNMMLLRENERVVGRLRENGIEVILLKGAALVQDLYEHIALRPMQDVDILIRENQLTRAYSLLNELGYCRQYIKYITEFPEKYLIHCYHEDLFIRKDNLVDVTYLCDVHRHLFPPPLKHIVRLEWFWQTVVVFELSDSNVRTLGREAQILHLCIHLLYSGAPKYLLSLYDLDRYISKYSADIDWALLFEKAVKLKMTFSITSVLRQTHEQLGTPLPAQVIERLYATQPSWREKTMLELTKISLVRVLSPLVFELMFKHSPGGILVQFYILIFIIFPRPRYMRKRYKIAYPVLLPVYYLYRFGRGVLLLIRSTRLLWQGV